MKNQQVSTACLLALLGSVLFPWASGQAEDKLTEEQAAEIGTETYIFGYPLVTMEMTRRLASNVAAPQGMRAPMGQFAHARQFPPVTFRDIPGANADTLYSAAWLDLGKEPYILSIPDAEGRYFMMPMLNGWSDVFQAPGSRTTGTKAQTYAITGPNWKGELPKGVTQYKSATDMVWIVGRTYCTGTADDYKQVHAFQDHLSLVPLSAYGKNSSAPIGKVDPKIDMKTATKDQVVQMDAATYFKLLATLMKNNPPTAADSAMVAKMAKIGLVPGKDWDIAPLDPTVAKGLANAPRAAVAEMLAYRPKAGKVVNGWQITSPTGIYGTNYVQRALLNFEGPGWNLPEDSIYPNTKVDGDGEPLNGGNKYVIRFAKGQLPPTKGFWSLTMYDLEGFWVANPVNRVNLNQSDKFNFNDDGSLEIYIQAESPGKDKEANWLPAPKGGFWLFTRLYWPNDKAPTILDGSWQPPGIAKVK